MPNMTFTGDDTLCDWLRTSARGHAIIREVLLDQRFWPQVVERIAHETRHGPVAIVPQPTLALVEIEPPMIRVYGEKHLRVHIAERPATDDMEMEIGTERWMELNMPPAYRRLYWPGMVRKTACIRGETVGQWSRRLDEARFGMSVVTAAAKGDV